MRHTEAPHVGGLLPEPQAAARDGETVAARRTAEWELRRVARAADAHVADHHH